MNENFNGFRMPAEWEPQNSVWIAWPYNRSDWPGLYQFIPCLLYTSPSPRDLSTSRMPSSA